MGKIKKAAVDFVAISKCRLVLLRLLLEDFKEVVRIQLRHISLQRLKHDAAAYAEGKKQVDLELSMLKTGSAAVTGALSPQFYEVLRHKAKEVLRILREGLRKEATDEHLLKLLRSKRKALVQASILQREFRPPQPDVKAARALIQEGTDVLGDYIKGVEDLQKQSLQLYLISSITADDLLAVLIRSYRNAP